MSDYLDNVTSAFLFAWLMDGVGDARKLTSIADRIGVNKKTGRRSLSFDFLDEDFQESAWLARGELLTQVKDARASGVLSKVDLVLSLRSDPAEGVSVPVGFLAGIRAIDEFWIDAEYAEGAQVAPSPSMAGLTIFEVTDQGSLTGRVEYRGRDSSDRQEFFDRELRRLTSRVAERSTLVVEFDPSWGHAGVILFSDLVEEIARRDAKLRLRLSAKLA